MKSNKTDSMANHQNIALVPVDSLSLGMYVSKLDKPWGESRFVFQGFLIQDQKLLQKVKDECAYVYIDIDKQETQLSSKFITLGRDISKASHSLNPKKDVLLKRAKNKKNSAKTYNQLQDIIDKKFAIEEIIPPVKLHSFEEEINTAQHVHIKSSLALKKFMDNVRNGASINPEAAKITVYECMQSVLRTPDAMMLMTHLKDKDTYTWRHSMNVCVLAISLGRYLNLSENDLLTLGLCGMLHDIGKMRIPTGIVNKSTDLDRDEQVIMQRHTNYGQDILLSSPNLVAEISDTAYSHHERLDGKGYPLGLTDKQISPFTKIVSIADMYDALTSDRVFRQSKTHFEAINIMIAVSGAHLDETLVNCFIQCIGAYPAGSTIEMNNGEIAIVIETNQDKKLRPKLLVLSDPEKKPTKEHVVNLADSIFSATESNSAIKTIISPDSFSFDVNKYYKYGVIQKALAITG